MTVEYSPGYIEAARKRLAEMEATMSPQALVVSRLLKFPGTKQQPGAGTGTIGDEVGI